MKHRLPKCWTVALAAVIGLVATSPLTALPEQTFEVSIRAQPLSQAMADLSRTTGVQVLQQALSRLLAGTGLRYRVTGDRTVTVVANAPRSADVTEGDDSVEQLPETVLTGQGEMPGFPGWLGDISTRLDPAGYKVDAPATLRLDAPLEDSPQSVSVIPEQVIEDQRPKKMFDLILNNASAQPGDNFFSRYLVRGFAAGQSTDGVDQPLFNNNIRFNETVNVARVEILKGPSSILYGSLQPGGTINRVTKKPLGEPWFAVDLSGGAGEGDQSLYEGTFDATSPLAPGLNGRIVGRIREEDTFRDFIDLERYFVAPSMSFEPNEDTSLLFQAFYGREDGFLDDGLPILPGGEIAPLSRSANRQEPTDAIRYDNHGFRGTLGHRFNDVFSTRVHAFYEQSEEDRQSTRFFGDVAADGRTQDRFFIDQFSTRDLYGVQSNLDVNFATGPLRHQLTFGADYERNEAANDADFQFAAAIDIFDPVFGAPNLGPIFPDFRARDVDAYGAFLQDRIYLANDRIVVVGGVRYDHVDLVSAGIGPFAPANLEFDQEEWSPRAGLVFKATDRLSFYASRSESFESSDPNAGFLNPGEFLEPELATQWEGGVRYQLSDQWRATLAIFDITKENVVTEDPDNPLRSLQVGEQKSHGVEVEFTGELFPGLKLLASGIYNDAEVTVDNTGLQGKRLANVPERGASVAAQYHFAEGSKLQGWSFGPALFYRGDRFADIANDTPLEYYVRLDFGIQYRRGRFISSANVKNLFDEEYFLVDAIPGAPTNFEIRAGWTF